MQSPARSIVYIGLFMALVALMWAGFNLRNGERRQEVKRARAPLPEAGLGEVVSSSPLEVAEALHPRVNASASRKLMVFGVVFDGAGSLAEGVSISVGLHQAPPMGVPVSCEGVTDEAGTFAIDVPVWGVYDIFAHDAKSGSGGCRAIPGESYRITLTQSGSIGGVVATSVPASSLIVEAVAREGGARRVGRVGEGRAYLVEGLGPGEYYVYCRAPGCVSAFKLVYVGPGQTSRADFSLERGMEIRGLVTDEETELPVEHARIGEVGGQVGKVDSGRDGRFLYRSTGVESATLRVDCAGYESVTLECTDVDSQDVRIVLRGGGVLKGTVVDGYARPIPQFKATVEGVGNSARSLVSVYYAPVDSGGDFRIDGVSRDRELWLSISAVGYGRCSVFVPAVGDGNIRDVGTIVLEEACLLVGSVVDRESLVGIEGCTVEARRISSGYHDGELAVQTIGLHRWSERTDSLGRFCFSDLSPGDYFVAARREGIWDEQSVAVSVSQALEARNPTSLVLALDRGVAIAGRVVGPDGGPFGPIAVGLSLPEAAKDQRRKYVVADQDGRFSFAGLVANQEYLLKTHFVGSGPSSLGPPACLGISKKWRPVDGFAELQLRPGFLVEGVLTRSGVPVTGAEMRATVSVDTVPEEHFTSFTNHLGEFSLVLPRDRELELECRVAGERIAMAGDCRVVTRSEGGANGSFIRCELLPD